MRKKNINKEFSYASYAKQKLRENKPAFISIFILIFLVLIAVLAPVLANRKPLYVKYKGENYFPAFSFKNNYTIHNPDGTIENIQLDIADWKHMKFEKVIWAPVVYSPGESDNLNSNYKGPRDEQFFRGNDGDIVPMPKHFRHKLGTDNLGKDLLSGLIHGARISLTIGLISMTIAGLIGILLGSIAGYFGDNRLITTRGKFWTVVIGIIAAWFYAFQNRHFIIEDALATSTGLLLFQILISIIIFIVVVIIFMQLGKLTGMVPFLDKKVHIPADAIVSRAIEIFYSMPTFILIITIAAIAKPSLTNVMIIIGLTSWTGIARLTRAEFLRIRNLEYIQAARALGFSELKVIVKHALPNGIAPALVSIAFGIASAILIESSLSFLGVGVPADVVTWGSLVNDGRENYSAWWLVIFPGLAIFITVTVYNLIGEGLRDALDPRQKT
ncbi:MAG: ABC transporter permease [Chitinophagales bacterium]